MVKYQVGDKVKVIANTAGCDELCAGWHVLGQGVVYIGATGVIESISDGFATVKFNKADVKNGRFAEDDALRELRFDEIKLINSKPNKNQRITALEETVQHMRAELDKAYEVEQDLSKRVSTLEFVLAGNSKLTTDVPKVVKSANKLRAEIIQRAKDFIENTKTKEFTGRVITGAGLPGEGTTNAHYDVYVFGDKPKNVCDVEFIVHQEKHTVVALMKGVVTRKIYSKGIAKCNPDDVFNEHIGKAIALGRALGLDVSEFEQAVQPTLAIGQIVYHPGWEETCEVAVNGLYLMGDLKCAIDSTYANESTIINDTNAIYETAVNE